MSDSGWSCDSIVRPLGERVFQPLQRSRSVVHRELDHVETEIRAFQRFESRVTTLDTVAPTQVTTSQADGTHRTAVERVDQLRTAYQQTVMAVPHYDDAYGESLETNAAAELSAAVTQGLCHGGIPFTDVYQQRLVAAVRGAVVQREALTTTLEAELDSLRTTHERLHTLLEPLQRPRIPAWHADDFDQTIVDLTETRQALLGTHDKFGSNDGHDVCQYLYGDLPWTYPVLYATAQLRETVEGCPE